MKRDFNIVTLHRAKNYGAVLQAYALRTFLENAGYEAGVFDAQQIAAPVKKTPRNMMIKGLLKLERLKYRSDFERRDKKFDRFVDDWLHVNKEREASVFLSGSDQVWNPIVFNPDYYLEFVTPPSVKASYAASIGVSELNPDYYHVYSEKLKGFSSISVREQSAAKELKKALGQQTKIRVDLDPVFLLTKEQWSMMAEKSPLVISKGYILLYILHVPSNLNELCRWLKRELNLRLVLIDSTGLLRKQVTSDEVLLDVGPLDFLSLIKGAEVVITTSFHGTAFSVIFEKEFYSIVNSSFASRVNNILQQFEMPVVSDSQREFTRHSLSFKKSAEVIEAQRKSSAEYFNELISMYEEKKYEQW